jgi:phage terminase small subunit
MTEDSIRPRVIIPGGQRLPPPSELTTLERKFWSEAMAGMPAGWFSVETLPLLRLFCRYLAISEVAMNALNEIAITKMTAKEFKFQTSLANSATTMVVKLANELQMTPKSRGDYHLSKKDATSTRTNPVRPWEIRIADDDEARAS